MHIKLEQYRVFNAVAAAGSISKAAESLYMTQSAVSQTVKQLEMSLGTALFVRNSKGVMLTSEGAILHRYSLQALDTLSKGELRLSSMKELKEGELKIGASDTISAKYLLPKLEKFHKLYPQIKIRVINRVTAQTAELVKKGKIDIGFGNLPFNDEKLKIVPCEEVHDIFVAKPSSAYKTKKYSFKEIADLPLILLEKTSSSRENLDKFFLSKGIELNAEIELGAHELLLQFAKIGLGISCVIKEFSEEYINGTELTEIKLREPLPTRAIGYFYQKHFFLSPAARRFTELLPEI